MPGYEKHEIEKKWQEWWKKEEIFKFDLNAPGKIYSIDNPPSFTSGTLHMGHALNHSWIDFMARYKRMRGYNILLPIGFDCHGLPTELKVAKEYGISPDDRQNFRKKCEEWTSYCIDKMLEQYKSLGYSADWEEYYETRSDEYKRAVQYSLLKFYEMGKLIREEYPALWCPRCKTALAKAEVGHVEQQGTLWYINLGVENSKEELQIATTRPEFMPACVAVMVHPGDKRYTRYVGEKAVLPYPEGRKVPIIADENVDTEFGTGVVYNCTFGDEEDVLWQRKHGLPTIQIIDDGGNMTKEAGKYAGMSAKEAQKAIAEDLKAGGYVEKEEPYFHSILCHTERSSCRAPVEFIPKKQWFIKVKESLPKVVKAAREMRWYPEYMEQRLVDWSESLTWDWIISRQRIYGTPVPFWYCEKCDEVIPPGADDLPVDPAKDTPPIKKCPKCGGRVIGTTDTCDCWVDSSISPLMVAHWLKPGEEKFFEKVYPTALRPQGYEIIRTWAFYSVFRCLELTGKKPFEDVVVNGMVAGPDGRKMSKSYGNVISPDEAIKKHGADALRQWALKASLGDDYPFAWKDLVYAEKFQKKYWNASYFASLHLKNYKPSKSGKLRPADRWILSRLNSVVKECTEALDKYEFGRALTAIQTFFWGDFCDNYLEICKHRLYNTKGSAREAAQYTLLEILLKSTLMLAPFIPHITEEVYHLYFKDSFGEKSVHLLKWPDYQESMIDENAEKMGEQLKAVIGAVRKFKSENKLPLNAEISRVSIFGAEALKGAEKDILETVKAKEIKFTKKRKGKLETELKGITLDATR
jgi:valyl-tRNA synthetase